MTERGELAELRARVARLERLTDRMVRALKTRTDTDLDEPAVEVESDGAAVDLAGQDDAR